MPVNFTINQAGGAGAGTAGKSRPYGIWQDVPVQLVAIGAGPFSWEILTAHPTSTAVLSSSTGPTVSLTPDVATYPYRIRITQGAGSSAITATRLFTVTKDNAGVDLNRGWSYAALGERVGEDNSDLDTVGYSLRVGAVLDDVMASLGGGGSGNAVVYKEAGVPGGNVYASFADALTAALVLKGEVLLYIDASLDIPTIPAASFNLERRVRVVAMNNGTGLPVPVEVTDGCVLANPVSFENVGFEGVFSSAFLTVSDGNPHDLTLLHCTYAESANSSDVLALGTGTNRLAIRGRSILVADARALFTLTGTKDLTLVIEYGFVGAEVPGGAAGTLDVTIFDSGTLEPPASFSGTLTGEHTVLSTLAEGGDPVNVNNQRVTNVGTPSAGTDAATKASSEAVVTGVRVLAALAAGVGDVAVNGQKVTNLGTPSAGTDAVTKTYADGLVTNLVGSISKDISAGGTITLGVGEHEAHVIRLTGGPATDTTVEFPSTNGREWFVTNEQTGRTVTVKVKAASGSLSFYLAPGQTKHCAIVNGELRADDEKVIISHLDITTNGDTVGNHDTTLLKLPAGTSLRRVTILGVITAATGTSALQVGTSVGGTQVLLSATAPVAGAVVGDAAAALGADMSANGVAYYSAATTLTLRNAVAGATLTAGAIRVTVEALVLA